MQALQPRTEMQTHVRQGQEFNYGNSRLSAAREHGRSETKYLPQSMASAGWSQYI